MSNDKQTPETITTDLDNLLELISDAIPIVDELCAWVNTDLTGCIEVQDRGENLLKRLRATAERHRT